LRQAALAATTGTPTGELLDDLVRRGIVRDT
jgi:hypothetical protein